jgi:hypothetical protein
MGAPLAYVTFAEERLVAREILRVFPDARAGDTLMTLGDTNE